jgi:hypothetical protein
MNTMTPLQGHIELIKNSSKQMLLKMKEGYDRNFRDGIPMRSPHERAIYQAIVDEMEIRETEEMNYNNSEYYPSLFSQMKMFDPLNN